MNKEVKKAEVIMIGAGPSALAAAVYTTRENIETILIEKGVIGGLAAITDLVDNYPGFSKGITGMELADELQAQAERFGAKIELDIVESIVKEGDNIRVKGSGADYLAKAVLIATGSDYKKIGVPGEEEFYGRGVHYCATCDGAFYRDKHIVVVGGGNSAAQEALFLTRFASKIDILIRGEAWKASEILVEEIEANEKITTHFNTTTDEIVGENSRANKVIGTDKIKNEKVEFPTDAVFVFVGLVPNSQFLRGSPIELDEIGFIKSNSDLMTTMDGVFVSGDVRSGATMQIASAVGEGATSALKMREYLEEKARADRISKK